MRRLLPALALTALLALAAPATLGATNPRSVGAEASTVTVSESFPINYDEPIILFVPCALGGAGEEVEFGGDVHTVFHLTTDAAGGVHVSHLTNYQGVAGVGLTSGETYRLAGAARTAETHGPGGLPFEFTTTNSRRLVGPGTGNDLRLHVVTHSTVSASGEVVTFVQRVDADCG